MDGIERELELPPAAEHDAYADERLALLPRTLGAAIEAWEATPFARETFGERFADNYAAPGALRPGALRGLHHRLGNAALPGVRIASVPREN